MQPIRGQLWRTGCYHDDATIIGLIQDSDESAYRREVERLVCWCGQNNLELNTLKTVEMTVDFMRCPPTLPSITITNNSVTAIENFKFLGSTISQDLKWETNTVTFIKKAQQRLYFLRQLRNLNLPKELLSQFYSAIIHSVLCSSITVWFESATKQEKNRLQWTIRTAEKIIGVSLPSIQDLYLNRVRKRAGNISADPSHPGYKLFKLLPSGRRYRTLYAKTSRFKNSFSPQAVSLSNS
ncbi:uncharacterized protein [Paralichthys olivaceus]